MQETWVPSLGWRDSLEVGMANHSLFLPGESQGQRSLAVYSLCGHKESDTTEQLSMCAVSQNSSCTFESRRVKI